VSAWDEIRRPAVEFLPNITSIHGLAFTQRLALMVFRSSVACDSVKPLLS
jgi:hypothetical protein